MDKSIDYRLDLSTGETLNANSMNRLATRVQERIMTHGYVHIQTPQTEAQFEELSSGIGSIVLKTDILINMDKDRSQREAREVKGRPSAFQAKGFDFHMDCPDMRVMSWLCKAQDTIDGTMLLLDARNLLDHFGSDEIEGLNKVMIRYSNLNASGSSEQFLLKPLVSFQNGEYLIYYQPWLLLDSYDPAEEVLLKKFQSYLKEIEKTHIIRIKPKVGECLFIDNRRLLHGRDKVDEQSNRHLIRLMLSVPEATI